MAYNSNLSQLVDKGPDSNWTSENEISFYLSQLWQLFIVLQYFHVNEIAILSVKLGHMTTRVTWELICLYVLRWQKGMVEISVS